MKIAVLGGGAWGTAIASVLAHNHQNVVLWCYEESVVDAIKNECCNTTYLPGLTLPKNIRPTTCLQEALAGASVLFEAVPVPYLRAVLKQALPYYHKDQYWVVLSKGLEQQSLHLPSEVLQDVFGIDAQVGVLMGPSFAHDVVEKQYTAVNLAATSPALSTHVEHLIKTDYFLVKPLDDMIGMQWCAVLKNCITVGMGILEGAGYTDNTKTFFLVQALQEIKTIVEKAGGKTSTVYNFAGIGDLMLTALGTQSRNLKAGRLKGQGVSNHDIKEKLGHLPEGFHAIVSVHAWLQKKQVRAPLVSAIYEIIEQKKAHDVLIHALLKTI